MVHSLHQRLVRRLVGTAKFKLLDFKIKKIMFNHLIRHGFSFVNLTLAPFGTKKNGRILGPILEHENAKP
jgi:hypothetical protein